MKKYFVLLFAALLLSCNLLAIESIFIKGKISCNEKGVQGVWVTDGRSFTQTDKSGNYTFTADCSQSHIYYTLPSGYESPIENGVPVFYQKLEKNKSTYNFELTKAKKDQAKHAFVVWADPQVLDEDELKLLDKATLDLTATINQFDTPIHAISCGDMVFDRLDLLDGYKEIVKSTGVRFYQSVGNHDLDYSNITHESATKTYESHFGPSYYSYNVGDIHYIVLNNVFYYGYSYHYMGYLDGRQMNWLEKDLSLVKKGKTIVVTLHIPTMYYDKDTKPHMEKKQKNSMVNNKSFYKLFDGYNVHILAGHSHTQWNTRINDSISEHVHAAISAAWWQGDVGLDGTPSGYTIYEVDGNKLSWHFKGVGLNKEDQMKVYPIGSDKDNPEAFIANVFNYDDNWTIRWYEDGVLAGQMERYWGVDPKTRSLYQPRANKKHSWLGYDYTQHIFKAVPQNKGADIEVEVVDCFGNVYKKAIGK